MISYDKSTSGKDREEPFMPSRTKITYPNRGISRLPFSTYCLSLRVRSYLAGPPSRMSLSPIQIIGIWRLHTTMSDPYLSKKHNKPMKSRIWKWTSTNHHKSHRNPSFKVFTRRPSPISQPPPDCSPSQWFPVPSAGKPGKNGDFMGNPWIFDINFSENINVYIYLCACFFTYLQKQFNHICLCLMHIYILKNIYIIDYIYNIEYI